MKLEKREGGWNEQDRKGEREKVLVTKERSSRGCVISTTHQRREILGSVVSFSLENILICAAAKFTETASIYKKKKIVREEDDEEERTRLPEKILSVQFHSDLIFPPRGLCTKFTASFILLIL